MTCKQTTKLKIVDLPSRALWDDVEKQLYRRAKALRRQRISKLAPFIPTVRHCLSKGYTLVAYRDEGQASEALIRMTLKELIEQLDPQQFAQVHRAVVVNLRSIRRVTRGENETADIELKGRGERLPVSRSHLQFFKEM